MPLQKHPILLFTQKLINHRVNIGKKLPLISAFYIKLFAREPFRLFEKIRFNDEAIGSEKLNKDPIFILGHWRSGTSFLQYIIARDPQFGYLSKFQTIFPDLFLSSEKMVKPLIERISDFIPVTDAMDSLSVNIDWNSPGELDVALTTLVSSVTPHWGHLFPKDGSFYFNKYLFFDSATDRDILQWKKVHLHLMKKLSIKHNGKRLIIKSPGNTARIKKLLELYPNAKFIYIHRNPFDLFYSNRKLWNILLDNVSLQQISRQEIDDYIFDIYERIMRNYLNQRSLIPEGNLVEIDFENFIQDPVGTVALIYNQLQLDGFENARHLFEEFVRREGEHEPSQYEYEPEIVERINKQWQLSLMEWKYEGTEKRTKKLIPM